VSNELEEVCKDYFTIKQNRINRFLIILLQYYDNNFIMKLESKGEFFDRPGEEGKEIPNPIPSPQHS